MARLELTHEYMDENEHTGTGQRETQTIHTWRGVGNRRRQSGVREDIQTGDT